MKQKFFKLAENSWQVFATLRLSVWEGSSNGLTAVWKTQHKAFYHFLHIPHCKKYNRILKPPLNYSYFNNVKAHQQDRKKNSATHHVFLHHPDRTRFSVTNIELFSIIEDGLGEGLCLSENDRKIPTWSMEILDAVHFLDYCLTH